MTLNLKYLIWIIDIQDQRLEWMFFSDSKLKSQFLKSFVQSTQLSVIVAQLKKLFNNILRNLVKGKKVWQTKKMSNTIKLFCFDLQMFFLFQHSKCFFSTRGYKLWLNKKWLFVFWIFVYDCLTMKWFDKSKVSLVYY